MSERFTVDDDRIVDNKYDFDMSLEEACALLNEYEGIILRYNPNF